MRKGLQIVSTTCFYLLLFLPLATFAQKLVSGTVKDEKGSPVVAATVMEKGSPSNSTMTNEAGQFSITTKKANASIVISYVGLKETEVAVGSQSQLSVVMTAENDQLNEVVVIGYGTQKKKNLTGAVSKVSAKDIGNQPVTSAANALAGRATGMQIIQGSAQPGKDAPVIQIRGLGTIRTSVEGQNNDAGPLILVDGVQSTMDDLNPNDIESFTILKDAASAAIYGARAANGVILVTTKRGLNQKPVINFSVYQAYQWAVTTPQMLDIYDYARLKNRAQTNVGLAPLFSDSLLNVFMNSSDPRFPAKGYTYFDDGYVKGAPLTNYNLSVTGGNENVKYLISGGYQDQDGIVLNTGSKRMNFRSNIDVRINRMIKAGLNLAGSYTNSYSPNYANYGVLQFIRDMIRYPVVVPETYPDGYPAWGNALLTAAQMPSQVNPIALNKLGGRDDAKIYRATPNLYLEFEPIKNLIFKANGSVFIENAKTSQFYSPVTFSNGKTLRQNTYNGNGTGQLTNRDETTVTSTFELTGFYNKKFGRSNFSALLGLSNINNTYNTFSASNQGYSGSQLTQLNAGTLTPSVGGVETSWALSSAFGRITYNYDERYYIEGNVRYDGSSRFGSANQFGTFPSVSVAWNVANENFMEDLRWVNELKLRASWGQLGNQNIGNYSSITTIAYNRPYVFGNALAGGAAQSQLGNPNVKWETSTSKDVGVDATFFNYHLSLTADWYSRVSTNLLVSPPISAIFGNVGAPTQNIGSVQNSGYEVAVSYNGSITRDLSFNVGFNWTHNDNKVTELDALFISANKVITQVGSPVNSYYGNPIIGIFQSREEAQGGKYGKQPGGAKTDAGDLIWKDTDGNGVVDANDRIIIGDPNIRNNYGFNLGLAFKGFDFKTLFVGVLGRDVENGVYGTDGMRGASNVTDLYLNSWTPDNPNTSVPRVATGYNYNFDLFVGPVLSTTIIDGSYLRMRSLELGYSLPKSLLDKAHIKNLRLYVAGQNLFTYTNYVKGFDPEQARTFNNNNDSYPNARTISFGASITL